MRNWLLTESDDVLKVVCLSGIGLATLASHRIVEHKRSLTLDCLALVELLLGVLATIGRMEIDHITRCEVHVLHVSSLLVGGGEVEVRISIGYRPLEHELRVRYVRRASILLLVALILRPCLWLFTLHRRRAISLGVHLRKLLLVC